MATKVKRRSARDIEARRKSDTEGVEASMKKRISKTIKKGK